MDLPRGVDTCLHRVECKCVECRNSTVMSTWSVAWSVEWGAVILRYYSTWSVSWSGVYRGVDCAVECGVERTVECKSAVCVILIVPRSTHKRAQRRPTLSMLDRSILSLRHSRRSLLVLGLVVWSQCPAVVVAIAYSEAVRTNRTVIVRPVDMHHLVLCTSTSNVPPVAGPLCLSVQHVAYHRGVVRSRQRAHLDRNCLAVVAQRCPIHWYLSAPPCPFVVSRDAGTFQMPAPQHAVNRHAATNSYWLPLTHPMASCQRRMRAPP